jgi:membrane protease YdiL (CAAX protease family)
MDNMNKLKYIIAILIGVLPLYVWMVWYRLTHSPVFEIYELLAYPLIFGGGNILLILVLNRYLLKERLSLFNTGKGSVGKDFLVGLILTVIYFALFFLDRVTIANWLPSGPPPSNELIDLMINLSNNPVLLAIWLGPVVWIGVALFEELSRTFFLLCLWKMSDKKEWIYISIIIVAVFVGVVHLYQGLFGIVSIGIKGLVMGFYYYKYRRILPLVISHALYDSIQVIFFINQFNN